jgi:hypothetical protein
MDDMDDMDEREAMRAKVRSSIFSPIGAYGSAPFCVSI